MHWINIGLVIVAGLNLGMALLVFFLNPKNKINISFSIGLFFIAIWSFGMSMFREAESEVAARTWSWIQNGGGALSVIPFYFFTIYFPYQHKKIKINLFLVILISILLLLFVVVMPDIWVGKINLEAGANSYTIGRLGIMYFALFFCTYLFASFYNLVKKYHSSGGINRRQLKYVTIATGVISFFGTVFAVILPAITLSLGAFWLGPFFSIITVSLLLALVLRA